MKFSIPACTAFILFIAISPLWGQQGEVIFSQSAEDFFLLGVRQYTLKEYKNSLHSFQQSIAVLPQNHRTTASMLMAAKSFTALKQYPESDSLLNQLLIEYPFSEYLSDAHFTLGMNRYESEKYLEAVHEMEEAMSLSKDRLTTLRSQKVIEHIAEEFLPFTELEMEALRPVQPTARMLLTVILAEKYVQRKNNEKAAALIKEALQLAVEPELRQRAYRLSAKLEKGNPVKIGVLLPLMKTGKATSRERRIATDILDGIQFALDEHEGVGENTATQVILDVKDSEHSTAVIRSIIESWSKQKEIIGIVGPIYSDESIAAASTAQEFAIPLITPTANDTGIAAKGEFVFQANPDYTMRGKLMAQYAVKTKNFTNVCVVAPDNTPNKIMADAFVAEARRLGASVVSDQRYAKGRTDLRPLFHAMRRDAFAATAEYTIHFTPRMNQKDLSRRLRDIGISEQTIDSLVAANATVSVTKLFGPNGKQIADSMKIPLTDGLIMVDSVHIPVTSIQAIFCPIATSAEIGIISSLITYYNFAATVLGTGEWFDADELEIYKRAAEGVVFSSDRWIGDSYRTKAAIAKYVQLRNKQPNDNIWFGYDAMSLMLAAMRTHIENRTDFVRAVLGFRDYQGVHLNISFNENRVNSHLHLLQYSKGIITKIGELSYQP